jgi:hypothetical protein
VLPVRFWHSRQWHKEIFIGSPLQATLSCPQAQVASLAMVDLYTQSFRDAPIWAIPE